MKNTDGPFTTQLQTCSVAKAGLLRMHVTTAGHLSSLELHDAPRCQCIWLRECTCRVKAAAVRKDLTCQHAQASPSHVMQIGHAELSLTQAAWQHGHTARSFGLLKRRPFQLSSSSSASPVPMSRENSAPPICLWPCDRQRNSDPGHLFVSMRLIMTSLRLRYNLVMSSVTAESLAGCECVHEATTACTSRGPSTQIFRIR